MASKELYLDCATAALAALTEAGIPADIQELLVRGDLSLGIAPGELSKAIKASSNTIFAALQYPTEVMTANGYVHCYNPERTWSAMLAASALGEQSE